MPIVKDFKFWLIAGLGLIYFSLIYYSKWVSSDGLSVTYQSYNVLNGLGLVWNLGERTYVSTSPLFTIVSIPLTYIFDLLFNVFHISDNKIFNIPIIINMIFSITSITMILRYLYLKTTTSKPEKIFILLFSFGLLLASKFYIDFSTSGLENSLSYSVIAWFTILSMNEENPKSVFLLPIAVALVFLTRYDFFLIVCPTILYYFYKHKFTKGFMTMCIIILSWLAFSFFYFGSIFPNSFYLKTNNFNFYQSLFYYKENIFESKPMFLLIALGLYSSYFTNKKIFLGTIFYLIYIFLVRDYMFGRLFTILVPISIISIIEFISTKEIRVYRKDFIKVSALSLILFAIIFFFPPVVKLYADKYVKGRFILTNEREYYTEKFSNINFIYNKPVKDVISISNNVQMLHTPLLPESRNTYFIDPVGLASPFITYYIKNYGSKGERPGHYFVNIDHLKQIGLFESVLLNKNILQDKDTAELYDDVNIVSKGSIFSIDRLKTIIKLHTHNYKSTKNE